jgi:hypothetical protein
MAAYQIQLSQQHAQITFEEAQRRMNYTKSTHNQKIESLWSRMMKEDNKPVIDIILKQIEEGKYNSSNTIEK